MTTLDSIKIFAPSDVILNISNNFKITQEFSDGSDVLTKSLRTAYGNIAGLKAVTINDIRNEVQLELSAKILLDDYPKLINKNTIEQVFDTVNRTGIITIDKARIDEFAVHSVDSTKNLKCTHKPSDVLNSLMTITQVPKYQKETYKGTGDNKYKTGGVVFRGKQKTFKERMLVYDKREELIRDGKFLKSVNSPMLLLNDFNNVVRNECNLTNYSKIRSYFNVKDQNLIGILQSDSTPNWTIYKRIKGTGVVQLELFNYPDDMAWNRLKNYYGLRQICIDLGNDTSLIKDLIRKHVGPKTGISQQMKEVKQVIESLKILDDNIEQDNEILQEFEQLLKVA
jgi:hypothetical protein